MIGIIRAFAGTTIAALGMLIVHVGIWVGGRYSTFMESDNDYE